MNLIMDKYGQNEKGKIRCITKMNDEFNSQYKYIR